MKKNIKLIIGAFVLGAIIFGGVGSVVAYNIAANQIEYTPQSAGWKVNSVSEAIDSLYISKAGENYSTDEKVVGTWIDGKPLYQKTIEFTDIAISSSQLNFGTLEGLNIDYGTVIGATVNEKDQYYEGLGYLACWIRKADNNFGIRTTINTGNVTYKKLWVTIQYTKTTDTVPSQAQTN